MPNFGVWELLACVVVLLHMTLPSLIPGFLARSRGKSFSLWSGISLLLSLGASVVYAVAFAVLSLVASSASEPSSMGEGSLCCMLPGCLAPLTGPLFATIVLLATSAQRQGTTIESENPEDLPADHRELEDTAERSRTDSQEDSHLHEVSRGEPPTGHDSAWIHLLVSCAPPMSHNRTRKWERAAYRKCKAATDALLGDVAGAGLYEASRAVAALVWRGERRAIPVLQGVAATTSHRHLRSICTQAQQLISMGVRDP